LIGHLRTALREIQALPSIDTAATPPATASNEPTNVSTKRESVAPEPAAVAPHGLAAAEEAASGQSSGTVKPSTTEFTQLPRRSRQRTPRAGD